MSSRLLVYIGFLPKVPVLCQQEKLNFLLVPGEGPEDQDEHSRL